MDFSEALRRVKSGKRINRTIWDGPVYIYLDEPMKGLPRLAKADGIGLPWAPNPEDVMAEDWNIVYDASGDA